MSDDDAERARAMDALDRLVSWAVNFKRQPLTDDLTVHQAGVLHFCVQAGPLGMDELARLLGSAPSTITALAGRLEHKGLLRRAVDPADGRKVRVSLTSAGRRRYTAIEARSRDLTLALFAGWTPRQVRSFRQLLEKFVEGTRRVGLPPEDASREPGGAR